MVAMSSYNPQIWEEIPTKVEKDPNLDVPRVEEWVDEKGLYHDFMFTSGNQEPVKLAAELQEGVKELPKTAATFTVRQLLGRNPNWNTMPDAIVELTGAWPVPETFPTGQKSQKWVNPHYKDAIYYSEVTTKCKCGAVMLRDRDLEYSDIVPGENEHDENCPKDWRLHGRARLAEKRRELAYRVMYLGQTVGGNSERLGLPNGSMSSTEREQLGIPPFSEIREGARQILANTWVRLLTGYTTQEVAEAYDVSAQTVRTYIRERTNVTPRQLRNLREGRNTS